MCGEKFDPRNTAFARKGSPPRVRGKVESTQAYKEAIGITPACAGKSCYTSNTCPHSRDHPRVCGEKMPAVTVSSSAVGSPPRVRGKDDRGGKRRCSGGITPACAGKSFASRGLDILH